MMCVPSIWCVSESFSLHRCSLFGGGWLCGACTSRASAFGFSRLLRSGGLPALVSGSSICRPPELHVSLGTSLQVSGSSRVRRHRCCQSVVCRRLRHGLCACVQVRPFSGLWDCASCRDGSLCPRRAMLRVCLRKMRGLSQRSRSPRGPIVGIICRACFVVCSARQALWLFGPLLFQRRAM